MKQQQTYFILIWLAVIVWIFLCELDVLPQGYLFGSADAEYISNIFCILTAVGGTYFACKLCAFKRAKSELYDTEGNPVPEAHRRWNNRRLALLALAILPSAFCYYAGPLSQTPLYCTLLALAGSLLCWPAKV